MIELFRDGGPFMYLVMLVGLVTWLAAAARVLFVRFGGAPGLIVGAYSLLLGTGLLGTMSGLITAFKAVAVAAPEYKSTMLAAGVSVAVYPLVLAVILCVPLVLLHVLGDLVGTRTGRPTSRADRLGAVGSAVVGLFAVGAVWKGVDGVSSIMRGVAVASSSDEAIQGELAAAVSQALYIVAFDAMMLGLLGLALVVFGGVVGGVRATSKGPEPAA